MKNKKHSTEILIGIGLFIILSVLYYALLVIGLGKFNTLFNDGFDFEKLPAITQFVIGLSNYWWSFSLLVIAGIFAFVFSKQKLGEIFYITPIVILVLLFFLSMWAVYAPIFSMENQF